MPSAEELEQYLDAFEISQLEKMRRAAEIMDEHDLESDYAIGGKRGDEERALKLG